MCLNVSASHHHQMIRGNIKQQSEAPRQQDKSGKAALVLLGLEPRLSVSSL